MQADITNAEWREFQAIPEQGHSHRAWVDGAIRKRLDQLRTDEAAERVADWLCEDDHGYKLAGHGKWCQDLACDLVESYRESARDLITALLGEEL